MKRTYTSVRVDCETANKLAELAEAGHRSKLGQIRLLVEIAHQQHVEASQLSRVRREIRGKRSMPARF
jgi:predicted transcriptional regulator